MGIEKGPIWFCTVVMVGMVVISCVMADSRRVPSKPLSLEALADYCRLPAPCNGRPLACDGELVTIWGYVDPLNVIDKQHYPRLPYEKFKLVDHRRHWVEVWPQAADNREIFNTLAQRSTDKVIVSGRLEAIRMPSKNGCFFGVKVLIDHATQIEFE